MTTILERYTVAAESCNLRHGPGVRDTDVLAAVSWADRELGSRVMRLLAHPPRTVGSGVAHDFRLCLVAWHDRVQRRNERRGWGLATADVEELARRTLVHYLVPNCPACFGRKKTLVLDGMGRNVLSDDDCPHCGGTGERPIDVPEAWLPYARELVDRLGITVQAAQRRARNYLR